MKTQLPLLLVSSLLAFSAYSYGQDNHEHDTPSAEEIGSVDVHFNTSCNTATAVNFNRGVALLHSFWFDEAIRTFDTVLAGDADCAIAHWGIAMAHWGNPFAGQRNGPQLARGRAAVALAQGTGSPSAREAALIDAVAILFSDNQPNTQGARTRAYEDAMAGIASTYPNDDELQIFYALAINQTASPNDKGFSQQLKAAQILEPLFENHPAHPGLAHYIIHAYDHPPLAEKALNAATRYASLAPAVPHALHMPSHTFTRVGMWQESVETNQRSADTSRETGSIGSELHALDYQTYAYLQMAQDEKAHAVLGRALELLENINVTAVGETAAGAFGIAAIPARYALERGDFATAAQLPVLPADDTPHTQAMTHFARALGAARSGNPAAAAQDIEKLAQLREALRAKQDAYWTEQVDIQWRVASAWKAFAEGRQDEAIAAMRVAAQIEDGTDKAAISPGPLAPTRELLGMMLLEAGSPTEALVELEASMSKEPRRFRTLYAAARAAQESGVIDKARDYYQELLDVAATADTDRAELRQARAYLGV